MRGTSHDILALADQVAERTSEPIDAASHRGIILRVETGAAILGVPTYTPRLEMLAGGEWMTIWTAAAAIAVSQKKAYALGPGATDAAGFTEAVEMLIPGKVRVVLAGGDAGNHANTEAQVWLTI